MKQDIRVHESLETTKLNAIIQNNSIREMLVLGILMNFDNILLDISKQLSRQSARNQIIETVN
jgi:hypothetical protein